MINWVVLNVKKYEEGMTFIVLITFSLTMIVIFVAVFMNFFSTEGNDIIIALIGICGAILGGVISGGMTLMGVKRTIKHEKDIRRKDQIPQKIELIRKSVLVMETVINETVFLPTQIFNDFNRAKDTLFDEFVHEFYSKRGQSVPELNLR